MIGEKISVITISYNSKKTIERTFQSVLKQSYRPLEYVLVDGESKDGTVELIQKYIPIFEDAGIEVKFKSEPDKGISDAFNKGIERATGEIIGITNSDDCISNDVLRLVAEAFDTDIDVVCGNCKWNDKENGIEYVRKSKIEKLYKIKYEMVLMHPTCYVRKRTYNKFGKFDCSLKCVMDKDLMARFYRNNAKFKYIDSVLSIMSAGGVSDVDTSRVYREGVAVAIRNGVPKWYAELRWRVMAVRAYVIGKAKKNKRLWNILRK
nr:glycosyltransferase family 2 protein [uncultured Blautia sp.]